MKRRLVRKRITVPGNIARFCSDFNAGRFYEAHEHLEEVWQQERGPARGLYQGLIQAAAAYVHLSRGNYAGARRLLKTSVAYLEPYRPGPVLGFDVEGIARALTEAREVLLELGPERTVAFPMRLRPEMSCRTADLPAEAVRLRAWGFAPDGAATEEEIIVAE